MISTIARLTLKRMMRGQALWVALGIAMLPVVVAIVLHQAVHDPTDRLSFTLELFVVEMFV